MKGLSQAKEPLRKGLQQLSKTLKHVLNSHLSHGDMNIGLKLHDFLHKQCLNTILHSELQAAYFA